MDIEEQRTPTRQSLPRSARLARIEKRAQEQKQARNEKLARARMKELMKEQEELAKILGGTSLSDEGKNYAKRVHEKEEIEALVAAMTNKVKIPQSRSSRARGKSRGKKKPSQKNTPNFVFQGLSEATFNLPSSGASVTASGGGPDVLSESMGGMNLRMPRRKSKSRRKVSRKKSRRKSKSRRKVSRKKSRRKSKSRRKVSRKKSRRRSKSRRKVSRKKSRRRSKSRRKVSKKKFQKKSRVGCWGGICGAPENDFPNKQPPSLPPEELARLQAARAASTLRAEAAEAAAEAEAVKAAAVKATAVAVKAIEEKYAKLINDHSCLSERYGTRKITCKEKEELNKIRRDYLGLGELPWGGCDRNEKNSTCFLKD